MVLIKMMLSEMMGHDWKTVLQRSLKQTCKDTKAAYRWAGPVNNFRFVVKA
jgi:hypothetical protein